MDEYEEADAERKQLLDTPCGFCGQAGGFWCVDAGGREIRNVRRQHRIRYSQSGVTRGELRALLVKARLILDVASHFPPSAHRPPMPRRREPLPVSGPSSEPGGRDADGPPSTSTGRPGGWGPSAPTRVEPSSDDLVQPRFLVLLFARSDGPGTGEGGLRHEHRHESQW